MGSLRPEKNFGQQAVNYEEYHLSAKEWVRWSAAGACACAVLTFIFYRSLSVFFILFPVGICYPLYKKKDLKKQRLLTLGSQFKEGIVILSSFLSAGYSVENAFLMSSGEIELLYGEDGYLSREFVYICQQVKNNRSIEVVLQDFADRSGLDDVRNFVQVFSVAKRSGGELVPIMKHTVEIIHDKGRIQEEIATLTASKRLEQKVMNLLPLLIVCYIELTSKGFFDVLYTTGIGRAVMTVCLLVYLLSYLFSGKILEIDV